MMEKKIANVLKILVCSFLLLYICGCDITLGPKKEVKTIIVKSGTAIEILSPVIVNAKLFSDKDGETNVFKQDIGGWLAMHPDHWISIKNEIKRLREKCGEKE